VYFRLETTLDYFNAFASWIVSCFCFVLFFSFNRPRVRYSESRLDVKRRDSSRLPFRLFTSIYSCMNVNYCVRFLFSYDFDRFRSSNTYRKRGTFLELVRTGMYDWTREEDRELFRAMLMTVCDLAAITKPWEIEKRVCIPLTTNWPIPCHVFVCCRIRQYFFYARGLIALYLLQKKKTKNKWKIG